ncbi:hypothetical protein CCHL11_06355 [Colletotrichum chlorophyti]|uniref:Uncharacterized protein n=1 Tax=Colletotrichum chlorophyti TaxID=708187 RepID=A0A1Q8RPW0_9PEZI|nr:hypothetical protein CCHL11_06355 [Colletotrichum chlorophyti]
MDDQFGGRTDDDLFFDDFEPVAESQPVNTIESVAAASPPPPPPPPAAVAKSPAEPPKSEPVAPKKQIEKQEKPAARTAPTAPRGGLANSRFADNKPAPAPASAPRGPRQAPPAATANTTTANTTASNPQPQPQPPTGPASQPAPASAAPSAPAAPASPAPTPKTSNSPVPHREKNAPPSSTTAAPSGPSGANTALNSKARLQSGANPRTKLTEAELAAKMEQMRILNAEKTRKFEQAEQDERSHAEAYARDMEEARKRKKADEERRRRGEEERKRMDDERAKNRERKLKAMSLKEGGWDEGKEALDAEEERRGFRGANGGVRGTRSGAGLAGSRFSREDDGESDRYAGGEERRGGRGRGRGRGQGRGGRGGRGGHAGDFERDPAPTTTRDSKPVSNPAPVITTEDFPALPSKTQSGDTSPPVLSPLGRWDDEMEAFDAKLKSAAQSS